ncbi:GntR family transcriptional regulator [Paenibacillus cremeus]|uniref:GntR family transcriptional regulator n=1 Tax=Paenibacillus cremeus TaxID=2163881 RepID=A0A559K4J6_9BACL|nr:GntR family transcriptional regulator [Paenibacillus cremeus]TVY07065.1 GntR family transcriptional regulator [Paenibacillus cremeus]
MEFNNTISDYITSRTRSIREVVYETLKESIVSGQLVPGHHLRERELAKSFGISTTPLKEALRRLEQEGLVTTSARKGTYVASDIMTSIEEINWARSALEGVAARLAALKFTEQEAAEFTAIIDQMKQATQQKDAEALIVLNDSFHEMIRTMAKNNYIYQQIKSIRSFALSFRKKALSHPDELNRAYFEHKWIYDHVMKRDAEGAEQAMISHIRRTISFVKETNQMPPTT